MAEPQNNEITIIAGDTQIKGEMVFQRAARIVGQFDGRILAKGELQVAESALCKADIETTNLVVDGTIEGNIHASGKVQLNAKARIKGDIVAEKMVTSEGASIFGQVAVGSEAVKAAGSQRAAIAAGQAKKPEPVGAK